MNRDLTIRALRSGLLLLLFAVAVSAAQGQKPTPSQAKVAEFQNALFRSTLDRDGTGRNAIDLYWESDALREFKGSIPELNTKIADLYERIAGDHVARMRLTGAGWTVTAPKSPFVMASRQPYEALLIVANATESVQKIRARLKGNVGAWQQELDVGAGETRSLYLRVISSAAGPLHARVYLDAATPATISLQGEVHDAVHLRVRIRDAEGKKTAARVYLRGADGRSYAPAEAFDRVMWMTGEHYFYSPGEVNVVLPAGHADIEVRKGFEYRPAIRQIDLNSGSSKDVDVRLEWLRDLARDGWFSGDDHIHGNYTGEQWSTPYNARLVASAEGLHVGNMMVSNSTGGTIHDERYFEGKPNVLSTAEEVLYWNQEMRTWSYGHLLLLNLKRLVRPIYTGFPDSPHWEDYPPNYAQAMQSREQGGITLYAHPALRFDEIPTGSLAGEAVADVALGTIDGIEAFCSHDEPSIELWYRFLNLGFRLGIGGGSDAFLNNRFAFLAGGERVYVYTGDQFSYSTWIDGLKRGNAFATVGPLLIFDVAGRNAGSELRFDAANTSLPVRVSAISSIPMSRIEIVVNGRVAAMASSPTPTGQLKWSGNISVAESSWVAARVWGPDNGRISNGPSRWSQRRSPFVTLLAHSGPVYVSLRDQPVFSAADRDFCLRWIDALTERIRKNGKFASETHRDEVLSSFARARRVYEQMGTSNAGGHH
jgi:hypothetical protein